MKCKNCNEEEAVKYSKYSKGEFCSKKCARAFSTKAKRKEINEKVSKKLSGRKLSCVIWNKGKVFKDIEAERYNVICSMCGIIHSNRVFCSKKCYDVFRRQNQSEFNKYKRSCKFCFNLGDYPDEFDLCTVEKFGWYKAKNHGDNLGGISRDHKYSVYDGFINNVCSYIIRHPANCELMKHDDNSKKYSKSSITLCGLLNKIEYWNKKYIKFLNIA